jgi:hypothetical protein
MKASEFISELESLIAKDGDLEVVDEFNEHLSVEFIKDVFVVD